MKEIWKLFNENIEVSNYGNIKYKGKLKKPYLHTKGYLEVTLDNKKYLVHRLVALTFLENKNNLPQVNHIDGNKKNNNVNNLEWCTAEYNNHHAIENNLRNKYLNQYTINGEKSIKQYSLDNKFIREFKNIREVLEYLGIKYNSHIYKCINGHIKSAYGYIWK